MNVYSFRDIIMVKLNLIANRGLQTIEIDLKDQLVSFLGVGVSSIDC